MIFITYNDISLCSKELIDCITSLNIDIIIPLAKKGNLLFNCLKNSELEDKLSKLGVLVISDRKINKLEKYDFLVNKKILLFDDSVKTGSHFTHTVSYLRKKINENVFYEEDRFEFYYFAYIKCEYTKFKQDFDIDKLHVYKDEVSINDYFDFCHNESIYYQRLLLPTSMDLPRFRGITSDIDMLQNVFEKESNLIYKKTTYKIANERFDLGVILINGNKLQRIVNNFLISASCKLRYEYDEYENVYNLLFTPFAICDSIKYDELELLYNKLFNSNVNNELKSKMNLFFVKLYRNVIYLLSYIIGDIIKQILDKYQIKIEFENDIEDVFDQENDSLIINAIDKYHNLGIESLYINDYRYTCKNDIVSPLKYTLEQIKIKLYDQVVRKIGAKEKNNINYGYGFVELNSLANIYNYKENICNFVIALFTLLENFSVSNEIEFNFENGWVERGLSSGESSISTLPIDDSIFYFGIHCYYNKVKKDYYCYRDNYLLFMNKFYYFLKDEGFLNPNSITSSQFHYLMEYYIDVNEDDLKYIIESKSYILNNPKTQYRYNYIKDWMKFILDSDDFSFN